MIDSGVEIVVLPCDFDDFYKGKVIEETIPIEWGLKPGDRIFCSAGSFFCIAIVVDCVPRGTISRCAFKIFKHSNRKVSS